MRLPAPDAAILEGHEVRRDINYLIKPINHQLGFDLSFHSDRVTAPLEGSAVLRSDLTALFRARPKTISIKKPIFPREGRYRRYRIIPGL